MDRNSPLIRISFLFALSLCVSQLESAELRTTVNNKTVYRQVAQHVEFPSSAKMIEAPHELLVGASGCASCGVTGCDLARVLPCGRWAEFEYLLWWRRGGNLPPLVTTSPNGTPLAAAGVLGQSGTSTLFGGDRLGGDARPGGRITLGTWLDVYQCNGVEGRFWSLGSETIRFNTASNGDPILARPFNNQDPVIGPTGSTSRPLAFPLIATNGRVNVVSNSRILGGDAVYRRLICDTGTVRIDLLAGYQFARIEEDLTISDSFEDVDPNNIITDGTRQDITDFFDTRNEFHGGQIGLDSTYFGSCWRLNLLAKVAFGNMHQSVTIAGQTVNNVPNDPNSPFILAEGLLANTGNQGSFQRDKFAVVPELGADLLFPLSDSIDLSMGYSFILWSNVLQPGDQINPALAVPAPFVYNDTTYWVHGFNAGVEMRF
jgi:hypothetical protein